VHPPPVGMPFFVAAVDWLPLPMICDLCKQDSNRIIRVASWQVCQWCVSNHVLDHALEVTVDIGKLRAAIAQTSATYRRDVRNGTTSSATSQESWRLAIAARQALEQYQVEEHKKAHKARHAK
jgi:hypothetical protein